MTRKSIELFGMDDSRAVSPVIGVILMVAITDILAAVIGTFVLGLGENVSSSTPQAQLTLSADSNNLTVAHQGGDPIPAGDIQITVSNSSGEIANFNPSTDATEELTVGEDGVLYMTDGNDSSLYWPTNVTDAQDTGTDVGELTDGTPYTVQIIHTESDQLIMDRTVRP